MSLLDRWIASFQSKPEAKPEAKGPKMAECEVCEKKFELKVWCQRTCGKECRHLYLNEWHRLRMNRLYREDHSFREKTLNRERERRRILSLNLKSLRLQTKALCCVICESDFLPRDSRQVACCKECSQAHRRLLNVERMRIIRQGPSFKPLRNLLRRLRYHNDSSFREKCLASRRFLNAAKRLGIPAAMLASLVAVNRFHLLSTEEPDATQDEAQG